MKRVLMVSPHFPPDTGAATHRVRLLAPHLPEFGWTPTVLSVDPRDYEGRLDGDLERMVPESLDVIRVRAWSPGWTRRLGFGDLGLRAFTNLYRTCRKLLNEGEYDLFFVTIFPTYPALLGPLIKRSYSVPFVLDYIDPWVGAWGLTTGPGLNGSPDLRSRLSRKLATRLEPLAVRAADGISAVSEGTFRAIQDRIPRARSLVCEELPYGCEVADFDHLRTHPRENFCFDRRGDEFHVVYMGTLLPLGFETLGAFLSAVRHLKDSCPDVYARLRLHFVGTSNQTTQGMKPVVMPDAQRLGVAEIVHEVPERVDYLDALNALVAADAILLMGSSEPHYTASKLYPALLAKRPVLAIYHEQSSVVAFLERFARPPSARVITHTGSVDTTRGVARIAMELESLVRGPGYDASAVDSEALDELSARTMARKLATLFDRVSCERD